MRKNVILASIVAIMLASISFASTYSVTPVEVSTEPGAAANVIAHITPVENDTFLIVPLRWSSWVFPEKYYVSVISGEPTSIPVKIIPFEDVIPGTYTVMINGYSVSSGKMYNGPVIVHISKAYFVKINSLYIYGQAVPLSNLTVIASVKNYGTKSTDVRVNKKIYANGELIYSNFTTISLNPGEEKNVSFTFELPAGAHGTYTFDVVASSGPKIFSEKKESVNIESKAIISKTETPYNIIFTFGKKITVENLGNVPKTFEYSTKLSKFYRNVLSTNGEVNGDEVSWKVKLNPGDKYTLYYKVNYFPYILLLIALAIVGWYITTRTQVIHVSKRIVKKDGAISVLIEIDNSTGREIKSITVRDTMIPIFKILPHEYGPLFKVRKKKSNFEIVWNIPSMAPGEQRILSYDAHEVIGVHGDIEFGPAEITYKIRGKEMKVTTSGASVRMESE